jgi:Fuc2NAc and GlcNAc transferase
MKMDLSIGFVIVAAFFVSVVVTGLMRRYALRHNFLDVPNLRSSHASPTPRGGGVAIVMAFLSAVLALAFLRRIEPSVVYALVVGGGATALVGYFDDRRSLRAGIRFTVHLAAAISVLILVGGISKQTFANWGVHSSLIGGGLALITLVWATNLFNFMDGIDGIAASESAFIAAAGAWINWYHAGDDGFTAAMLCLAAASLGFLRWNWPPARIFMGDVGSGFLGFSLAVFGLSAGKAGIYPVEVWAILGGWFLTDATVTLLRRMARGDKWLEAHRMHAYQHLARRWKAHMPVTVLVTSINLLWLLPWAIFAAMVPARAPLFVGAALIPLVLLTLVCGAGAEKG